MPAHMKNIPTTHWSTRNMRKDLLARMKLFASIKDISVERTANMALEAGLHIIERKYGIVKEKLS